MRRSIIKPIVFGALFGAALFFAPFFLLKVLLFVMVLGFIFRMFWWSRWGSWHHHRMQYAYSYADKIRGMSDEEYAAFKNRSAHYSHCGYDHSCCDYRNDKATNTTTGTDPVEKK